MSEKRRFDGEKIGWEDVVLTGNYLEKSCFTKKIRIDGNRFLGYFMNNDFIESTDAINKI